MPTRVTLHDADTGEPVSFAAVAMDGKTVAVADVDGAFLLPDGEPRGPLRAVAVGYDDAIFSVPDDVDEYDVPMIWSQNELPPVEIEAEAPGLPEPKAPGWGAAISILGMIYALGQLSNSIHDR
jgi:hypothetical protein